MEVSGRDFQHLFDSVSHLKLVRRIGRIRQVTGLLYESDGPDVLIGDLCQIRPREAGADIQAEVVGLAQGRVLLMPFQRATGIGIGCEVIASGRAAQARVGEHLLGRVIDAFGEALDDKLLPSGGQLRSLKPAPINPLQRQRIDQVLETGVKSIDCFLTIGRGQRVGIFAGSGVGKSTLLGMIAKHAEADVNVIALIGERGREVKEFIEEHLGEQGMQRSVVVVATSDQSALARLRAAYLATTIAEYFRDLGKQVFFTMDSVTRFAMARREIGLAVGEPPTARGYTPSVFNEIPELCERCGTNQSGGAITALYTVLVEGDDFNEPVSDMLRATLDGHIVLTRKLAQQGHYPAIDVLKSASRLLSDLTTTEERELIWQALELMSIFERNRQMIEIGAYQPGSYAEIDKAIQLEPKLREFLKQMNQHVVSRTENMTRLKTILSEVSSGSKVYG